MCFMNTQIKSVLKWNWGGDTIVQSPIIPSSQTVPHTRTRYEIDIREYILGRENAVLRNALDKIVGALPDTEQKLFLSRCPGAFDFRMRAVTAHVYEQVKYAKGSRRHDAWLYPDQTLANNAGDCEDRALLVASLLIASGISSYVVRVALGKLYNRSKKTSKDHVWVMYRNEDGFWMLIEPLLYTREAHQKTRKMCSAKMETKATEETVEYIPYFVFNNDHMWRIRNNTEGMKFEDYLNSRSFWDEFDPTFAAAIHNSVFDSVLEKELSWHDLLYVKQVSLAVDINPFVYDPRDHFDNGYIKESWHRLQDRITKGKVTLDGLALAGHAIADFYAHSSYAHFGKKIGTSLQLFDGNFAALSVQYGSGPFNVGNGSRFTVNDEHCTMSPDQRVAYCTEQKLISGRFAQSDDPYQSVLEKLFIYIPHELRKSPDYPQRCCLPHHDEIAVDDDIDDDTLPSRHSVYSANEFREQFRMRKEAAIRHFRQLYDIWERNRQQL